VTRIFAAATAALVCLTFTACGNDADQVPAGQHAAAADPTAPRSITVTSPAFGDGEPIPSTYTCSGKGISPPIQWTGVDNDETGRLALVVDDADAPGAGYVHWVVLGIPTGHGAIDAGELPDGATEVDASGGPGWTPPCPPSGTHHYRFTLYAFRADQAFSFSDDTPLPDVLSLLAEHAVAWGRLTGTVTAG
jgi:Raf kinase inhibitor-like YbhB/YbcL family protein